MKNKILLIEDSATIGAVMRNRLMNLGSEDLYFDVSLISGIDDAMKLVSNDIACVLLDYGGVCDIDAEKTELFIALCRESAVPVYSISASSRSFGNTGAGYVIVADRFLKTHRQDFALLADMYLKSGV